MMRLLRMFLVISSALAARAAADPIDRRTDVRPQSEAFASAPQGNRAEHAAPSGVGLPSSPNAMPRTGNPLSAIPLSALSATRDRPLFSLSRRPPPAATPVLPPPPPPPAPPPPPEQPAFTLTGTIVSKKASVAILQGPKNDAISLQLGEENNGWQVRGIGLRSIVVEKGTQSVELNLPKPNGAQPDLPKPNGAQPDLPKPNGAQPDLPKPNGAPPDLPRPSGAPPDLPRPDGAPKTADLVPSPDK